ncbi:hypothetical protein Q4506_11145 [Colwellia sp. 4_MG-2023]|uniref:hypothetical protein n=1 Tax=unclassified Colwellia TaxID=196834 RepID=UPI001C0920CC|nr:MULTISPECIES: hypothetical protein [unclassified Colwellia]MBU2925653.1 hypothetical protein [Colwellia sp. C2M11]MDO6507499.1 hypothetical protein [Colwellia sp. 5_MG-2023]MDO6556243.1 hypothetical protein [Colwellia sp. 4_MG-2023]MDO6651121.1 hypothetical protein [Colwellia sp. 3_MG-2023]MDO6666415.1 hypothetical protein [Colwellia sp. 2_MG-2023]
MDIFTTALTRVVQVPIKPTNNKVKGPSKTADTSKLTEDLDHIENHDTYFDEKHVDDNSDKEKDPQQESESSAERAHESSNDSHVKNTKLDDEKQNNKHKLTENKKVESDTSIITESEDGNKHLDLYI